MYIEDCVFLEPFGKVMDRYYVKLQEAYASERNKGGDWNAIGYKSPAGNSTGKSSTSNFEYDATQTTYNWTAKSIVGLNDCAKGKIWFVNYQFEEGSGNIKFWATSDDVTNCSGALTPNFSQLSNTTTAITSAGGAETVEQAQQSNTQGGDNTTGD